LIQAEPKNQFAPFQITTKAQQTAKTRTHTTHTTQTTQTTKTTQTAQTAQTAQTTHATHSLHMIDTILNQNTPIRTIYCCQEHSKSTTTHKTSQKALTVSNHNQEQRFS
jgi:hypothetical protein